MLSHRTYWRVARCLIILALILQALAFPGVQPVRASGTLTVTDPGDADSDGCSIDGSDGCTLREAVTAASPGDTIQFDGSLSAANITLTSTITIDRPLTLRGGPTYQTIKMASGVSDRLFSVDVDPSSGPVMVKWLKFIGARAQSGGGAAYVYRGDVTFDSVLFTDNQAAFGGALAVTDANVIIRSAKFESNWASDLLAPENSRGGGAIFQTGGTVLVQDSSFAYNWARYQNPGGGFGGAYNVTGGQVTLENVTILENSADAGGGGLALTGATASLDHVKIESNDLRNYQYGADSPTTGGGLYSVDSTLTITDSRISGNSASLGGGAMLISSPVEMTRTEVNQNSASTGCIIETDSTLRAASSTFRSNTAARGLICANNSPLFLSQSVLSENNSQASLLTLNNVTGSLDNNTITENRSSARDGAALWLVDSPTYMVRFNTIVQNLYARYGQDSGCIGVSGSAALLGNIVADNLAYETQIPADVCANQTGQVPTSLGYNRIGAADSSFLASIGDQLAVTWAELQLSAPYNYGAPIQFWLPGISSPLVNQVPAEFCPLPTDQRGIPRPSEDLCEIGSVEVLTTNLPPQPGINSFNVTLGVPYTGQLLATDPEGDSLTFSLVTPPNHAEPEFTLQPDGSFTYRTTSTETFDAFTFRVADSTGSAISSAYFLIGHPPAGPLPFANGDGFYTIEPSPTYAWVTDPNARSINLQQMGYFGEITTTALAEPVLVSGHPFTDIFIYRNGYFILGASNGYGPRIAMYPFDQTLQVGSQSRILLGTGQGDLVAVLTYENLIHAPSLESVTFQALLYKTGRVVFQYQAVPANLTGEIASVEDPNLDTHGSPVIAYAGLVTDLAAIAFAPSYYLTTPNTQLSVDAAQGLLVNDQNIGPGATAAILVGSAHGLVSLQPDGSFTYQPDPGFVGADHFSYLAHTQEGDAGGHVQLWVNAPPTFTGPLDFTGQEDSMMSTLNIPCSDPGGTHLTPTWTDPGNNVYILYGMNCSLFYLPAANFAGSVDFDVTVTDEFGESVTAPLHLEIQPVNDAPFAVTDGLYTGGYSWKTGGPNFAWEDISQPENAIPISNSPVLEDKPIGFDFPVLDIGGVGRASTLRIRPFGIELYSSSGQLLASGRISTSRSIGFSPGESQVYVALLKNPVRTVVTLINTQVSGGTDPGLITMQWVLYPSGRLVAQFQNTRPCLDQVSFSGPTGLFQVVTSSTMPAESVIEFVPDQWTAPRSGSLHIPNSRLTANDLDIEGDDLLALPCDVTDDACIKPQQGSWVEDQNLPGFIYTPNGVASPTDTVGYGAADLPAAPYSVVGKAHILIDDLLVVAPMHIRYAPDAQTVSGSLPVTNPETGEALSFGLAREPQHGTLTINETTGAFVYTPSAGWQGSDTFDFWAYDQDGQFVSGTVSLARNHAPVTGPNSFKLGCDKAFAGKLDVSDPDAQDSLTLNVSQHPAHGRLTLEQDGDFTYIPDPGFTGDDSFTVRAADDLGAVTEITVTLTVETNQTSLFLPLIGSKK